jgi:Mrp family chromosome partitioning ATPase
MRQRLEAGGQTRCRDDPHAVRHEPDPVGSVYTACGRKSGAIPVHCDCAPVLVGVSLIAAEKVTLLKPDTGQLVWTALRRSIWLLVVLLVAGVVTLNLMRQQQGELYSASAEVILSPTDLAGSVVGSNYIDPDRLDATEEALANSRELYERAARRAGGALGTGSELQDATSAEQSGTSVTFTAESSDSARAVGIANAVAASYPAWRADVSGAAVDRAMSQLRAQLRTRDDPELRDQMARLSLLKTLTAGNVLLVERAPGASKVRPNPVRDSIAGLLLGLLVGLITVGIREAIDTRVRSEAEVEELLDAPVVGSVERLPGKSKLVVLGRHGARFGDVYGLLAATVAQSAGEGGRVIAVTSATAQEGKTTTAANLGAALAKRNSDVVLVDLDSRNPALATAFGLPPSPVGTPEVLERRVDAREVMREISLDGRATRSATRVQSPSSENTGAVLTSSNGSGSLRLLPASRGWNDGVVPYRASLRDLVNDLREQADFVIIDTSPALSTADASEIVKVADMALIVVRQGRVTRRILTELSRLIRTWPSVSVNAVLVDTVGRDEYAYYPTR